MKVLVVMRTMTLMVVVVRHSLKKRKITHQLERVRRVLQILQHFRRECDASSSCNTSVPAGIKER